MRALRLALLLAVAVVGAGCVSTKMAEANEEAVGALAEAVVQMDEANLPLAEQSADTAAALTVATGTLAQIASLGVPSDLTKANFENVRDLAAIVNTGDDPGAMATAREARRLAADLDGRAYTKDTYVEAAKAVPWFDQILKAVSVFGAAVGSIYGVTRGPMHLKRGLASVKTKMKNGSTATAPPAAAPPAA